MAVASKTWDVGEILEAGNFNTYIRDNLDDLQSNKSGLKSGSYSGDGNASQAITGVGFQPTYLIIWESVADSISGDRWETTASLVDNDADGLAYFTTQAGAPSMQDFAIKSLDADGFTVGTGGGDPNDVAKTYEYMAWGS